MLALAEYIWIDGASEESPVQHLRSKTRVVDIGNPSAAPVDLKTFPVWNFDGSSTNQSGTDTSDQNLRPVRFIPDPVRKNEFGGATYLVLCEVDAPDGNPHPSNARAKLRKILEGRSADQDAWFGFEQEYVLYEGRAPIGWPKGRKTYPGNQGPFYCGVGDDEVAGRQIAEDHLQACIRAGILIYGINAEVMLGQWEFQIGYRGFEQDKAADPLTVSDHLWLARWLLYRIGENYGVSATLDCKPERGDWNGSGAHTNFSTKEMRDPATGRRAINSAISALEATHRYNITQYGYGLERRLTGKHETCNINEFVAGESNRGASIRIPKHVDKAGYGYIEDRRPGANCDPYKVCAAILGALFPTQKAAAAIT